jgi:hypothetical protein
MKVFWILPLLGLLPCLLVIVQTDTQATSAPQQAVGAAYALAWVVIPYCIARAITELGKSDPGEQLKELREILIVHTKLLASVANAADPIKPETLPGKDAGPRQQ